MNVQKKERKKHTNEKIYNLQKKIKIINLKKKQMNTHFYVGKFAKKKNSVTIKNIVYL